MFLGRQEGYNIRPITLSIARAIGVLPRPISCLIIANGDLDRNNFTT